MAQTDGAAQDRDRGYSATLTHKIVGISYRQLDHWARTELVVPSVAKAAGSGSRRLYSYDDVLTLKVIKRLLDHGIQLQKVRSILDYVRNELGEDISSANIVIDGNSTAVVRGEEEIIDAVRKGQGILPLSRIGQEVDAAIVEFRTLEAEADDDLDEDDEDAVERFAAAAGD